MSVPRLFKRLSQRSLRKRNQSVDVKSLPDDQQPPPLPSQVQVTASSPSEALDRLTTPSSTKKAQTLPLFPPPGLPNGKDSEARVTDSNGSTESGSKSIESPNGEDHDVLASAWNVANTEPPQSKADKLLEQLENHVSGLPATQTNYAAPINNVLLLLPATGGLEAIEQGVHNFLEGSALLMKSLDEIAKIHPFVGVAVMAFKAVWTLEVKRRENDKRIIALHVEMKNMMTVLLQLKNVKDPAEVAPDGTTIGGRMQELAKGTAEDITNCANACDTYSKKKLVVKVIKGPIWESRLLEFVRLFTKRRSEFEFALTIHTARGVDKANQTLGNVDRTTAEMNAKMDMMVTMFERFLLPEQKEMALLIQKKGGAKACQENDKILQELSDFEKKKSGSGSLNSGAGPAIAAHGSGFAGAAAARNPAGGPRKPGNKSDFDDLKDELHTEPDAAMEKNLATFSRKFEIQKRQITEELSKVMRREGDRIINAITSGPHDKIIDPDVYRVWKEMNWRGSVKARHFVMALRDYFHEKWNTEVPPSGDINGAEAGFTPQSPITDPHMQRADDWALAYLNVMKLQPISEAFDDDASGFITVAEVNTFTTSRPLGWSLPHWIAYWAIGWHHTLVDYVNKISIIVGKMYAVLPTIRPENRTAVNDYLLEVYVRVKTLHSSPNACPSNDALRARFKSYVDAEEERLKANLEAVDYDIDAMNTLALVTGPGRIDRFLFPLLYLLLKRHFEIFRISQKRIVHPDELWDAANTMEWVFDAVDERVYLLQSIFKQQKLDVDHQFKTFAHGIFEYWNDDSDLWAPAAVRESDTPYYPYDDTLEEQNLKAENICNHPLDEHGLDYAAYDPNTASEEPSEVSADDGPLKSILGPWNGSLYQGREYATAGMISFTLTQGAEKNHFQASARSNMSEFTISGTCSPVVEAEDKVAVSFKRTFPARFPTQYWDGEFDPGTDAISGTVHFDEERRSPLTFLLKRTPPEQLRFRPPPATFETDKPRVLWTYALSAARAYVRQQSWSWAIFRERRDIRKRFIQLYIRSTDFGESLGKPLDGAERAELNQIRQGLTAADSRFYHSLARYQIRITTRHGKVLRGCDACGGAIGSSLIFCVVCQTTQKWWNSVDLCDSSECVAARVERDDLERPHLPTHDLAKVRRVIHLGEVGQLERMAKSALECARKLIGLRPEMYTDDDAAAAANASRMNVDDAPKCIVCSNVVTQPCWYCVECEDDKLFICNECDAKGLASFEDYKGAHDYDNHALVRCQELVEDVEVSVEERLASLEAKFASHENSMNDRLVKLESRMDDRLSVVEKLLRVMHTKLGVDGDVEASMKL